MTLFTLSPPTRFLFAAGTLEASRDWEGCTRGAEALFAGRSVETVEGFVTGADKAASSTFFPVASSSFLSSFTLALTVTIFFFITTTFFSGAPDGAPEPWAGVWATAGVVPWDFFMTLIFVFSSLIYIPCQSSNSNSAPQLGQTVVPIFTVAPQLGQMNSSSVSSST